MSDVDKYHYCRPIDSFMSKRGPYVLRTSRFYQVEVMENVDSWQYISFSYDKLKTGLFAVPKSTKYEKVRPIISEIFFSHYNLALKFIHEALMDDGEFYLLQNSKSWFQIAYYSSNEKEKQKIVIDFRDAVEDLWLTLECSHGHSGRPAYRKKALSITADKFKQFLNCSLQFLFEANSYNVYCDDFIRKIYQLVEYDGRIEGFVISAEKSFETIVNQLLLRKSEIESRLIGNDTDSSLDRAKLRGELEGLNYCLKVMQSNGIT